MTADPLPVSRFPSPGPFATNQTRFAPTPLVGSEARVSHSAESPPWRADPMIAVSNRIPVRRALAAGFAVAVSACTNGEAAQGTRDVAMFRGGATRNGVYAASPGSALAGIQWRFLTEGDVVGSPTVLGQTVYIGSGDGRMYALDRATGTRKWAFDAGN